MLSKKLKWGKSLLLLRQHMPSSKVIWPSKNLQNKGLLLKSNHLDLHSANFCDLCLKRESSLLLLQNYANEEAQNKGRPPKLFKGHLELVDSLLSFFLHPNSKFSPHTSLFWSHWAVFLNSKWRNLRAFFFWEERFIIHLVFIYFTSFRKII